MISQLNNHIYNFSNLSFKGGKNQEIIYIPDERNIDKQEETISKQQVPVDNYTNCVSNYTLNIPQIYPWSYERNFNEVKKQPSDIEFRNQKLKEKYGIISNIKNPKILDIVEEVLEDYCRVYDDKNLFKGECELNLKDEFQEKNSSYKTAHTRNGKHFFVSFNKDFDFEEFAKKEYICGSTASENKNYQFYKAIGNFLNYKDNPNNYDNPLDFKNIDELGQKLLKRVSNADTSVKWCGDYIALKTLSEPLPGSMDNFYEYFINGKTKLKFPSVKKPSDNLNFKVSYSIDEAKKILNKNFGIKAEFDNEYTANACVRAVKELTKATHNNKIFNGLEIKVVPQTQLKNENAYAMVNSEELFNSTKKIMYVKQDNNPLQSMQDALNDYEQGGNSSPRLEGVFIHELAHYLDGQGERVKYHNVAREALNFSEMGKNLAAKVSSYAMENPCEFCAEYVAGKMEGTKYSPGVDALFNELWKGLKIYFQQ